MIALLLFLFKVLMVIKTIALPFIALVLTFSILAPSLAPLLHQDWEIAILVDAGEEEKKSEKESEKKFDEKDLYLNNFGFSYGSISSQYTLDHTDYLFLHSDFVADIPLPPPRILT